MLLLYILTAFAVCNILCCLLTINLKYYWCMTKPVNQCVVFFRSDPRRRGWSRLLSPTDICNTREARFLKDREPREAKTSHSPIHTNNDPRTTVKGTQLG